MSGYGSVTFLGTGTSHGVPMIGCRCGTCLSADPRDRRLRPSVYLALADGTRVLVDTTPDLRQQALAHDITRVDAILYTHCHADHVMGLDEVRRFNTLQHAAIPCYGDARTMGDLRRTFAYIFESTDPGGGVPQIHLYTLGGPFSLGRQEFIPVPVMHGRRTILGFRLGGFAYLTDCSGIPDSSWSLLRGLDTLVIDALRHRPHPTHFTVAEALGVVEQLAPRRALLTHICHDLPHDATGAMLPPGVEMAYDGLTLPLGPWDPDIGD
ncbi:MAG: MBL fold metallo-hydrolase [Acidobacteria bacterium]|nr:MBL fold metallo-hydrolase [Acidobacteriota bacterium]